MPHSIAVAGKGGTGKTTLAALLLCRLRSMGETPILAIDADPDSNLGTMLGIQPRQSIGELREEVLDEIKNFPPGMSKAAYVESGLHQIIEEADGFDLITMGRGEGSGCYCYLNSLIRKFSDDLFPSYRWVVMDNEAGLEHISRRTSANIDALVVVVGENPVSLNTARTIQQITDDPRCGISRRLVVMNMVRPEREEQLRERLGELDMELVGSIPYDPEIEQAVFSGKPLTGLEETPAWESIDRLLRLVVPGIGVGR
ncbi:MAG: AAA family ATPase [Spirochaetota bacterium]